MKKLLLPFFIVFTVMLSAQNITKSQFKDIKVDDLPDSQISEYWEKAQDEGYTMSQLEMIAKAQGMSSTEFSKLRSRINNLSNSYMNQKGIEARYFPSFDRVILSGEAFLYFFSKIENFRKESLL